ncbi:histidine kinase [Paenibacillus darwinianus]|uniref:histidine kinase n=1 Tax=Paenibacillus darwinianus TaxID=1380763 RepID=A0A9W5W7T8_9BACL|nr:sensor histidine kinase [Paenibacillus darwinianus]EXX89143.1 histidine kinase [Paenibacillus darwinianus]EXX89535.1 histidine kinase [Paenibacillus darwinianus]EXX89790.1 histidine kinase [Paenibacillus darwinianus]
MWELLPMMFERLGIIVTVAFVMTRFSYFRRLIDQKEITTRQQINIILMFGCFGIIGTYTGLTVNANQLDISRWTLGVSEEEAIANSRVIGIVVAGLLGGIKVGVGAGLIAGAHRLLLGGFTGFACGLSTVVAGILTGWIRNRLRRDSHSSALTAWWVGMLAESVQMLIILLVARPFDQAWSLVQNIAVPMILANGVGSALFIVIIRSVIREEEKNGAVQAQKALRLADRTLKYMQRGMSASSADKACRIILSEVESAAVAISDGRSILAHVGLGEDHHHPGDADAHGLPPAFRTVLHTGTWMKESGGDICCARPDCTLQAAIVAPLLENDKVVGTLTFYYISEKAITPTVIELITGLSRLLSRQLVLGQVQRYQRLAAEAEIKALQAQISPHFMFNTLNTVVSLTRTDPSKARKLLIALSRFLRQNVSGSQNDRVPLSVELDHVKAYLQIQETRFIDKLNVTYDIDERALTREVPSMLLQPLVENALKHGLKPMKPGSEIRIRIREELQGVLVSVEDNGRGIEPERMRQLAEKPLPSNENTGIGLYNVNKRLLHTFGESAGLQMDSEPGRGSRFRFLIPTEVEEALHYERTRESFSG